MALNTLGKNERLKSRKLIAELFSKGKAFSVFPFRVVYVAGGEELQAGFTVSTRNFKKAVDRNRIKRLMKEVYRVEKGALTNVSVFFIYTGKELPAYELVKGKMKSAIDKLVKIINEPAG